MIRISEADPVLNHYYSSVTEFGSSDTLGLPRWVVDTECASFDPNMALYDVVYDKHSIQDILDMIERNYQSTPSKTEPNL